MNITFKALFFSAFKKALKKSALKVMFGLTMPRIQVSPKTLPTPSSSGSKSILYMKNDLNFLIM